MFSDNWKTIVGADIELKKLHDLVKAPDETLVSYFNDEHIDWNFIPPKSPNFGGLWESVSSKPEDRPFAGASWIKDYIDDIRTVAVRRGRAYGRQKNPFHTTVDVTAETFCGLACVHLESVPNTAVALLCCSH
ncbi:hypothetical protein TNCV_4180491 [Trichonephila clavipes]|nr:hypothetical protein TNCV_4180491 [Trichonephila clavipes]